MPRAVNVRANSSLMFVYPVHIFMHVVRTKAGFIEQTPGHATPVLSYQQF